MHGDVFLVYSSGLKEEKKINNRYGLFLKKEFEFCLKLPVYKTSLQQVIA